MHPLVERFVLHGRVGLLNRTAVAPLRTARECPWSSPELAAAPGRGLLLPPRRGMARRLAAAPRAPRLPRLAARGLPAAGAAREAVPRSVLQAASGGLESVIS